MRGGIGHSGGVGVGLGERFSHDWCVEDDFVRISGEDHFSGLKSPKATERCGNLAKWGWHKYPYLFV